MDSNVKVILSLYCPPSPSFSLLLPLYPRRSVEVTQEHWPSGSPTRANSSISCSKTTNSGHCPTTTTSHSHTQYISSTSTSSPP